MCVFIRMFQIINVSIVNYSKEFSLFFVDKWILIICIGMFSILIIRLLFKQVVMVCVNWLFCCLKLSMLQMVVYQVNSVVVLFIILVIRQFGFSVSSISVDSINNVISNRFISGGVCGMFCGFL